MPRRKRASKATTPAAPKGVLVYRVRIAIPGSVIHVVSATKPVVHFDGETIVSVDWLPLVDSEVGDTIAFIRWEDVSAVAWRPARLALGESPPAEPGEAP